MTTPPTPPLARRETVATCGVCGESVTLLEAPLHAEDHAQRGEYPSPAPPRPTSAVRGRSGS